MRIAFVKELFELAKKDSRITLICGDIGYSVFEEFLTTLPKQFLNAGVSEQNMTGLAAGMAMEGKIPIIYSIMPFVTMRNFEQVRNDICYQNLNVKIVGVGAGFSYGPLGHTHHGLEDLALMRPLPNMTIFSPGDPYETKFVTKTAIKKIKGPTYIRLGKAGEPTVHKDKDRLEFGKAFVFRDGSDVSIIATSNLVPRSLEVAAKLDGRGIKARVVSMHTIKPLDKEIIVSSAKKTKNIFSLEEHSVIGGLGSAIAEVIAEEGIPVNFKRIGVPDRFSKKGGLHEFMRKQNGLGVSQITEFIISNLSK